MSKIKNIDEFYVSYHQELFTLLEANLM